jgi:hypothetical protein
LSILECDYKTHIEKMNCLENRMQEVEELLGIDTTDEDIEIED